MMRKGQAMKTKFALVIVLILGLSAIVEAAPDSTRVDKQVTRLQKQLDLTTEQMAQIREIYLSQGRDKAGKKSGTQAQDISGQIDAVLTDVQRTKYAEILKAPRRRRPGDRAAELIGQLNLDQAQAAEVRKILDDAQEERRVMRETMQDGSVDREKMRETLQKMNADTDARLAEVLTEEQMTQYQTAREKMRKQRGNRRGGRGR